MSRQPSQLQSTARHAVMVGLVLVLGGCATTEPVLDSRSMVTQPHMTADCPDVVEVKVKFIRHASLTTMADAYEKACRQENDPTCVANAMAMKNNNQQALAFTINRPNNVAELHYIAPRDFNDWYRLAVVGHETMHLCGARHDIMPTGAVAEARQPAR